MGGRLGLGIRIFVGCFGLRVVVLDLSVFLFLDRLVTTDEFAFAKESFWIGNGAWILFPSFAPRFRVVVSSRYAFRYYRSIHHTSYTQRGLIAYE